MLQLLEIDGQIQEDIPMHGLLHDCCPNPHLAQWDRIKSGVGHLSNEDCGELLASVNHFGLKLVVLMHISETNNHPELAKITALQALGESLPKLILAQQNHPTELLSV